jgi:hypothetical protein
MSDQSFNAFVSLFSRLPARERSTARSASVSASGKKKGSINKKARQKCRRQVASCEGFIRSQCDGDQTCIEGKVPCCALLNTCDFFAFSFCVSG